MKPFSRSLKRSLLAMVIIAALILGSAPQAVLAAGETTLNVADWSATTTLANVSGRPTVLYDNGTYHLWHSNNSDMTLYYTTSTDPTNFALGTQATFPDATEVSSPAILLENGIFYMVKYGDLTSKVFSIYTSTNGIDWVDAGVVYDGTGLETFDAAWLKFDAPYLLKDGDTYKLYFQMKGSATGTPYYIFMAETGATTLAAIADADDDIDFTLANGNQPVLSPGDVLGAENRAMHPMVVKEGSSYYMWYTGHGSYPTEGRIFFATSVDGIQWVKGRGLEVIDASESPMSAEPMVVNTGAGWHMWYLSNSARIKHVAATGPFQFSTVHAAVDAAIAGDTIQVAAGTYVENILIDKAVTLLGPNAAINPNTGTRVAEAILQGSTSTGLSDFLEVDSENVVIKGFTFDNLRIDNYNNQQGNNTLLIGGVVIENNIFSNIAGTAIYLRDGRNAPGSYSTNVEILNNQIAPTTSVGIVDYNAGSGIIVMGVEASTISGNVIQSAAYNGIQIARINGMAIIDNTATGAAQPALQIAQWNDGTLTISGNTFSTLSTTKAAVRLYGFTNEYYPLINLTDNTIRDSRFGIQIGHGDAGKNSNDISAADYSFDANTFENIGAHRLIVYLSTPATVENLAEMDALFAQTYLPGTTSVAITSADPFTYVASGCTTDCYVSPTGSDVNRGTEDSPFLTFQEAIDTVALNGTVHVAAGTYDEENILITKGLTLQGAGAATTFIAPSTITNQSTIVVQNPTGNVTIDGFTFVMQPKANYGSAVVVTGTTIAVDSATVTISNNIVAGSNDGSKSDYGFYGQNNNASLVITDNVIDKTGDNSITMENQAGSTTTSDNIIRIPDDVDYNPYFSMTYGGVIVTTPQIISGNTIYLDHAGTGWSEAITFVAAANGNWANNPADIGGYRDVQIQDNIIYGAGERARGIGIFDNSHSDGNGTISGLSITGNSFIGENSTDPTTIGIYMSGDVEGAQIKGNSISDVLTGIQLLQGLKNAVYPSGTVIEFNRIVNTGTALNWTGTETLDASPNWWGCNAGTGDAGCAEVTGQVNAEPWLVLTLTADQDQLVAGGTINLVASLTMNSQDEDTTASGYVMDGIPVDFATTYGTLTPESATLVNGVANFTLDVPDPMTVSGATVTATVDGQTVEINFNGIRYLFLPFIAR